MIIDMFVFCTFENLELPNYGYVLKIFYVFWSVHCFVLSGIPCWQMTTIEYLVKLGKKKSHLNFSSVDKLKHILQILQFDLNGHDYYGVVAGVL